MADSMHRKLIESKGAVMAVLTTVAISIGGLVEIAPLYSEALGPEPMEGIEPLTPLELAGRDIYVREGCYNCHSQMVRPFRDETLRYGEWTRAGEIVYDRPFQMGSRRIGPDLQRVGGKYPDAWHYEHMDDPRATSPGSIMPRYSWLKERQIDPEAVQASMRALQTLGTPYTDEQIADAPAAIQRQGGEIVARLEAGNLSAQPDDQIVALTAYLQQLGVAGRKAIQAQKDAAAALEAGDEIPASVED